MAHLLLDVRVLRSIKYQNYRIISAIHRCIFKRRQPVKSLFL